MPGIAAQVQAQAKQAARHQRHGQGHRQPPGRAAPQRLAAALGAPLREEKRHQQRRRNHHARQQQQKRQRRLPLGCRGSASGAVAATPYRWVMALQVEVAHGRAQPAPPRPPLPRSGRRATESASCAP